MTAGPTVAGGRVPVLLHLLAPNGRAVQVTSDLAGFWERAYPSVRKELSRKYPKHRYVATQIASILGENKVKLVPDIAVSGDGGSRLADVLIGRMLAATMPMPTTPPDAK